MNKDVKSFLLGCVFALIVCYVIDCLTARAAQTGAIIISGVVPAVTSVLVTPQGTYNGLDLTTTQADLLIANVREINNTQNGYVVTATSSNAGKLKKDTNNQITYTAKYNGSSFSLSTLPVQVTNQGAQVGVVNVVKPLTISYTGVPSDTLLQGTYSDTITLTITAN